jgi:hypothetical protein
VRYGSKTIKMTPNPGQVIHLGKALTSAP